MALAAVADPRVDAMTINGDQIRERRTALRLTVKALAERAGVDRGQLAKIEAGNNARPATLRAVDAALASFENEGHEEDVPAGPRIVTFRVKGNFGVEATVEGPVEDLDALEASVARLIEKMGRAQQPNI